MRTSKKIIAFNNGNGIGVVRDGRGKLTVLCNKRGGKNLSKGRSVFVTSQQRRDIKR